MRKNKAFTLIEILIAIGIISVILGFILIVFQNVSKRSQHVEAVVNVNSIGKAEEIHKTETGDYVAADNIQQINERLGLTIEPKSYTYRVVGVTNDNFIVIARKIGEDIESGKISPDALIVADRSGIKTSDKEEVAQEGETDEQSSGDTNASEGDQISSSPGGDLPSETPGGVPEATPPSSDTPTDDTPGGDTGDSATIHPNQATVPASVSELLNGTISGDWAYALINDNNISVVYVDVDDYDVADALAFWWGIKDHTERINGKNVFVTGNTIFINKDVLSFGYTDTAIASIITHESTHADYSYHPQEWIAATKLAHPELTDDDIHITRSPGNSIDQEYHAFNNQVNVWKEIKGADTNEQMDIWEALQATEPAPPLPPDGGEAAMKAEIRTLYGTNPPDSKGLPEY